MRILIFLSIIISLHVRGQYSNNYGNFKQNSMLQLRFTRGLFHQFGSELTYRKVTINGRPTLYIEIDWELIRDYTFDFYNSYGIVAGHSFLKYFFIGVKVQKEERVKTPFIGLEVGTEAFPFKNKNFSINSKIIFTAPPLVEGVSFIDIPELQIGLGYRFDRLIYQNFSMR